MDRFGKINNTLLRNAGAAVILTLLICMGFTGCADAVKSKVVIIHEDAVDEEQDNECNSDFNIKKIYSYDAGQTQDENGDNRLSYSKCFGWVNRNNFVLMNGGKELIRKDYRFNFSHLICEGTNIIGGTMSPDGGKLAYYSWDGTDFKIYLQDTSTEKPDTDASKERNNKPIYSMNYMVRNKSFKWSVNGRYLSFIGSKKLGDYLVIYDALNASAREFKIIYKGSYYGIEALVQEDGRQVSLLFYLNEALYFSKADIRNNTITIDIAQAVKIAAEGVYYYDLREDCLVYLDNNILYRYDIGTGENLEIARDVDVFELSSDSKYIAFIGYSMKSSDVYVGKLTKSGIENKKLIYKQIQANNLKWCMDNKKILFEEYGYSKMLNSNRQNQGFLLNKEARILVVEFDDKKSGK